MALGVSGANGIASAQQSGMPAWYAADRFIKTFNAKIVSRDSEPIPAFEKMESYCDYVQFLLENADDVSTSMARLADGLAEAMPSGSEVRVLGLTTHDCDGVQVAFFRVRAMHGKSAKPHVGDFYVLTPYVQPPTGKP